MNRGLLSWVEAHALMQSSHRVQRSKSIIMACVPLIKRFSTRNSIRPRSIDFARVVTQTRNVADTGLSVQGPVAQEWMAIAQCFAGAPETPPPPGARHRVGH